MWQQIIDKFKIDNSNNGDIYRVLLCTLNEKQQVSKYSRISFDQSNLDNLYVIKNNINKLYSVIIEI